MLRKKISALDGIGSTEMTAPDSPTLAAKASAVSPKHDGVDAPLLTASQCAKVAMFSHPTNEEGIHGKG
jgi:hypothetical protein